MLIMIVGLLITLYTGFKYVTTDKIVEIGNFQITAEKANWIEWSPWVGVAVIIVGGIMVYAQNKRS